MKHKASLLIGGWLLLGLGLLGLSSHKLSHEQNRRQAARLSPLLSHLAPGYLSILTLGHRHLYEDFVYLWLLQYLMPEAGKTPEASETLMIRIEAALTLQPKFESIYLLSCFVLAMDYHRPDLCEKISRLGLQVFPDSWRIPMTQAYMFAFRLENPLKAAFYYHLASSRPSSPPYVASLMGKLLESRQWSPAEQEEVLQSILNLPKSEGFKALLNQ